MNGLDEWVSLKDAVHRIASRSSKPQAHKAANDLYEELRRGNVLSQAGRVFAADGPGSTWALANWPFPSSLWQVVTLFEWKSGFAVTWVYPGNEPRPDGWPVKGAVKLTDIVARQSDIDRIWPTISIRQPRIKTADLLGFVMEYADGKRTEAECRKVAASHFGLKSIPLKNIWRPLWQRVPSTKKLPRGGRRKIKQLAVELGGEGTEVTG